MRRSSTPLTWEHVTLPVARGKQELVISAERTLARTAEVVNVDRELGIAVTFHSPPVQLKADVFDHPSAFMERLKVLLLPVRGACGKSSEKKERW